MTANPRFSSSSNVTLAPTGTVTFLFSDIEGSSRRWETYREAMDDAVKRHDARLRAAVEAHHGYVFKTVGDAFCVTFARVSDAVAAIVEAQRALSGEEFSAVGGLRVRYALHTGEAVERDGDYFGPTVNRVARLMSIGHGGQILLSNVTRGLVYSDLPAGTSLVDLGSQRLKDLTEPEHVWQLNIDGLPNQFPRLLSLDAVRNNLPIQRTTFVGREDEVAEVRELVERHSLVTLVGAGGVGKTRLALEAASEALDLFPDGAWFADLAAISDPELVASVIAKALGMSQQEGSRIDEAIPHWLKPKKLLLILDNCEHILETVSSIVAAVLRTAADASVLATSRQALSIQGESVHRLPSLSIDDAVALFVDRATAVDSRFRLTDDAAPIVADICRRLDGIPLAIELAAARVRVLSIPHLSERLNERFRLLTGTSRDALPRQKTLGALIDWSYDLLTQPEQLLFARLGIFEGGFGLDAVTRVCGQGLDELEILDLLTSLTDKSLVVADIGGDRERYRLLESTSAYALEKLSATGERDPLARRHAEYFREHARAAYERYGRGSTLEWVAEVALELDNYRAALTWALTQKNDFALGGDIAGSLLSLWDKGGLPAEGRYWIGIALDNNSETEEPLIVASLRFALANLLVYGGKRAYDEAELAMRLYEAAGDLRGKALSERHLAFVLYQMGRLDDANAMIERAIATFREWGDERGVGPCFNMQAMFANARGDRRAGRELYAKALSAFQACGNETGAAVVLSNLGELEFGDGNLDEALRYVDAALAIDLRGKNATNISTGYANGAAYRIAAGDLAGAREAAREGLRWGRQAKSESAVKLSLQHLAELAALSGDVRRAAGLLGYVDAQYAEQGLQRGATERSGYERRMASLRETLTQDRIEEYSAEGAAWSEDRAIEEALNVSGEPGSSSRKA